jgi:hypothetical protein
VLLRYVREHFSGLPDMTLASNPSGRRVSVSCSLLPVHSLLRN